MGGKCSYAKDEIKSELSTNQNIKVLIDNEIPINQPCNSIIPKLLPQNLNTTMIKIIQKQVMDVDDQQQQLDNSLISSYDRKLRLQNMLDFMNEKEEQSMNIKKSKKKSGSKRKRVTMEDLEQIF